MSEQDRIIQSNEVAHIVFDEHKKAFPDLHPLLEMRYGVANALWLAGYRKTRSEREALMNSMTTNEVREMLEILHDRLRFILEDASGEVYQGEAFESTFTSAIESLGWR